MASRLRAPANLIGITGRAGSGKDTVSRLLRTLVFTRSMSFAEPLKAAVAAMLGVDVARFEDREWKEAPLPGIGVTPRHLLQTLGTEWGRNIIDPDLWVKIAANRYAEYRQRVVNPDIAVVFTDLRFPNEAQWIREQGGLVLRVQRDSADVAESDHDSETQLINIRPDTTFANNGSFDDLRHWLRNDFLITDTL